MKITAKKITAAEEPEVVVEETATDLLFEAEDVAELLAEVTGEAVEVTAEEDSVTFAVGENEFTVEPEGDEELLEAATSVKKVEKVEASRTVRRVIRK